MKNSSKSSNDIKKVIQDNEIENQELGSKHKVFNQALKYPLVLKQIGTDLVISVPDFGFYESVELTAKKILNSSNSSSIGFNFDHDTRSKLCSKIADLWEQIQNHLEQKKWIPEASSFKQSLQQGEEDFSLPEFTKKIQEHMYVSENTIRREIAKGKIRCYQTDGGHRRIPISELKNYLENSKARKIEVDL